MSNLVHKVKDAVTGHSSSSKGSSGQYDSAKQSSNYGSDAYRTGGSGNNPSSYDSSNLGNKQNLGNDLSMCFSSNGP
jgi:hypothetical protein